MPKPNLSFSPDPTRFERHVEALRASLAGSDSLQMVATTGASYQEIQPGHGVFHFSLWGQAIEFSYPEYIAHNASNGQELPLVNQALLLYYFATADGAPSEQGWVAFSELPDGRFYNQAFQGYTGRELARQFQNEFQAFENAAWALGGTKIKSGPNLPGDLAFAFQALPRVPLLVAAWQGDEDFPSSFQILFDASVSHYLSTDSCAILGSMLTRKLIAQQCQ
jgi:hypothetical protein